LKSLWKLFCEPNCCQIVSKYGFGPICTNLIVTVVVAYRHILQHSKVKFFQFISIQFICVNIRWYVNNTI